MLDWLSKHNALGFLVINSIPVNPTFSYHITIDCFVLMTDCIVYDSSVIWPSLLGRPALQASVDEQHGYAIVVYG
jgi:hypothetical protein